MIVEYIVALIAIALMLAAFMAVAWIVQQRTGNSGWVDTIWTFAVGTVGAVTALVPLGSTPISARQMLVATLIAIWSLRLGSHIALRTTKITDDPRYAEYARQWGGDARARMFVFLQNQAAGSIPLVFAVFVAAHNPKPGLDAQDYAGLLIVAIGVVGEAIADFQLRGFRADPANAGRVCEVGLWRWSRHPNYFFEWLIWLAWPMIAISSGYLWGWAALLGPAFMYWILVHVTGIPPLEEHMLRTRGEAFRDYRRRTSAFFPRPPRRQSEG
jgi:steroid 5-alpha reductase family enzyme